MKRLLAALIGLLTLAWASSACAVITKTAIGGATATAGATTAVITTTGTCSAGNALLVMVTVDVNETAATAAVTDLALNTYAYVTGSQATSCNWQVNNGIWACLYIATNNANLNSGQTITYTTTSGGDIAIAANCVTGLATSSPLDISKAWVTTNFNTTLSATATGTLSQANELLVTTGAVESAHSATTPVCSGSFTTMGFQAAAGGSPNVWWCGLVVAATTTVTGSLSWTNSSGAEITVFTLKAAGAAAPATCGNSLNLMGVGC